MFHVPNPCLLGKRIRANMLRIMIPRLLRVLDPEPGRRLRGQGWQAAGRGWKGEVTQKGNRRRARTILNPGKETFAVLDPEPGKRLGGEEGRQGGGRWWQRGAGRGK